MCGCQRSLEYDTFAHPTPRQNVANQPPIQRRFPPTSFHSRALYSGQPSVTPSTEMNRSKSPVTFFIIGTISRASRGRDSRLCCQSPLVISGLKWSNIKLVFLGQHVFLGSRLKASIFLLSAGMAHGTPTKFDCCR